jgi:hypothetical protein
VDLGVVAARSADGGATWTTHVVATDTALLNDRGLPYPCASALSGRVFVTYHSNDPAAGQSIGIGWSDDDGTTWVDPVQTPLVNGPSDPIVPTPSNCVAQESVVRVSYGVWDQGPQPEGVLPQLRNFVYAVSTNGGTSFPGNFYGGDGILNATMAIPRFVADGAGGFDLVLYEGYGDGSAQGGYLWGRGTISQQGAVPPSFTTIESPLVYLMSRNDPRRLGDYTGLADTATTLFTSYVDNTSGASHVRVHVAPLP